MDQLLLIICCVLSMLIIFNYDNSNSNSNNMVNACKIDLEYGYALFIHANGKVVNLI